jgi:UTP--glucose-1-phosphate uridylyltransferase
MANANADSMSALKAALAALPSALRARLDGAGFRDEWLIALAASLQGTHDEAVARRDARNRVTGAVTPPTDAEVPAAPRDGDAAHARLEKLGLDAITRGELAMCVMAGGMATRMGGVVKALVEALPGRTFLDLRLAENATWSARAGVAVPLWLMTSEATDLAIAEALERANAPVHVARFTQNLGLRLTPEGALFREEDGEPSVYATGHGDLPDALRRSGLLGPFRERGGKYVWIANLDNLGATIDPAILGHFIETGRDVMVEVAEKAPGDKGGVPVHAMGRLQVLEEFRLPKGFDASSVRVFNTNTFLVRADALATTDVRWTYFEVEKKVEGGVAIQFERLLQELTVAMPAAYVTVQREGTASRFLPVKDFDELARRASDIASVARSRGMIAGA